MKSQSPSASDAVSIPGLVAAAEHALPQQADALARARGFAEPLIGGECLDSGENTLDHADAEDLGRWTLCLFHFSHGCASSAPGARWR